MKRDQFIKNWNRIMNEPNRYRIVVVDGSRPIFKGSVDELPPNPISLAGISDEEWNRLKPAAEELSSVRSSARAAKTAWAKKVGSDIQKLLLQRVLNPGESAGRGRSEHRDLRRTIYELHCRGLTSGQIARKIGKPKDQVKSALTREKRAIRAKLAALFTFADEAGWSVRYSKLMRNRGAATNYFP